MAFNVPIELEDDDDSNEDATFEDNEILQSSSGPSKRKRTASLILKEIQGENSEAPANTQDKGFCKHCINLIDHYKHVDRIQKHLKKCLSFVQKTNSVKNSTLPDHLSFMKALGF